MNFTILQKAICTTQIPVAGTLPQAHIQQQDSAGLRRRRAALKAVDRKLSRGNFKRALSIVKQLQGTPGGLRGFGAAKQVPKRVSSLEDLELNGKDFEYLQLLLESVMDSIRSCVEFASVFERPAERKESLMDNRSITSRPEDNHYRSTQHEAGHFLVGYLLGVLPKEYRIPSIEYLEENDLAYALVQFVGFEKLTEVGGAKMMKRHLNKRHQNQSVLNKVLCIILGGLVAEHLEFGYAKGFRLDVMKLVEVLQRWGCTDSEADLKLKWAATNTILILHRHQEARLRLAEAMASGRSIGSCIDTIESAILGKEI